MSTWVNPEWLPTIPENDRGPFHCYLLWVKEARGYYVGHTGDPEERIQRHFEGGVKSTQGFLLTLLWVSDPMRRRREAQRFEAAIKSYILQGNERDFIRCTDLDYLVSGAVLL